MNRHITVDQALDSVSASTDKRYGVLLEHGTLELGYYKPDEVDPQNPHDPDEIIASVDKGIYAKNFAGGQVDITSGKFVFSTSETYLIEGGKLGAAIKDATLIGDGPSVLQKVSMVGNDLELDSGIGVCGKDGQSVPVGVGQPTLRVDGLTVGGVAGE